MEMTTTTANDNIIMDSTDDAPISEDDLSTTDGFMFADEEEQSIMLEGNHNDFESHSDDDPVRDVSGPLWASNLYGETGATSSTVAKQNYIKSKREDPLAPREATAIYWTRALVVTLIILSTIALSTALYLKTSQAEEEEFQRAFQAQVMVTKASWENYLERQFEAMSTLSTTITMMTTENSSQSENREQIWPMVTIPGFLQLGSTLERYTESYLMAPFLKDEESRMQWESYASQNLASMMKQGWDSEEVSNLDLASNTLYHQDNVTGVSVVEMGPPPYAPVWQHYPIEAATVNYNLASDPILGSGVNVVLSSQMTFLGETTLLEPSSVPLLPTLYPIYGSSPKNRNMTEHMVVGLLMGLASWARILDSPSSTNEDVQILVVVDIIPSCSSKEGETTSFSFLIDDSKAVGVGDACTFLGKGDRHDPSYEAMGLSYNLTDGLDYQGFRLLESSSWTGCNSDDSTHFYQLSLYPTKEIWTSYHSTQPLLYSMLAMATGIAILLAFGFFDWCVRRRHAIVSHQAIRDRQVIASLFPSNIHDRLFQNNPSMGNLNVLEPPPELAEDRNVNKDRLSEGIPLREDSENNPCLTGYPREHIVIVTGIPSNAGNDFTHALAEDETSEYEDIKLGHVSACDDDEDLIMHKQASGMSCRSMRFDPPIQRLRSFLSSDLQSATNHSTLSQGGGATLHSAASRSWVQDEPIADLFPECTVMFADISGFTAWSSIREPVSVFKLLETIFLSFDKLARKNGVFKVETIGDCYVAVTGLPEPRLDHAIIMCKFARESMQKMNELVKRLEVSLGPDTAELCMRYGLHSGPVTAGVLRGEKSRFQLFGDTVNFASRMESTGKRNKIQCSKATADLLIAGGKSHWLNPRDDLVDVKGKGVLQTFFVSFRTYVGKERRHDQLGGPQKAASMVNLKSKLRGVQSKHDSFRRRHPHSEHSQCKSLSRSRSRRSLFISQHESIIWSNDDKLDAHDDYDGFEDNNRQVRLIEWNVEILTGLLRSILAHRQTMKVKIAQSDEEFALNYRSGLNAMDEITEIIPLGGAVQQDDSASSYLEVDPDTILLSQEAEKQLRDYVTIIACMYRDNPFHNFEHASHVLNSVQKLLKRVIIADQEREDTSIGGSYTTSIASDPMTQFAIVFSALIHDVDHTGVPNGQLIKEEAHVATLYNNKSVAEQNSLDLAFELLMDPGYKHLQRCIFCSKDEFLRFRQLLVNVVIATDIFDKDMKELRNNRWEKAFQQHDLTSFSQTDEFNLKGTIVLEYIMQASDVAHTMQHWHVYIKWNERLFEETYNAFSSGRGERDPSGGWYKGELWFFDNYVIPLAKKLKECRVFGAASDECLNYAISNRTEWEAKGEKIVTQFVAKVKGCGKP